MPNAYRLLLASIWLATACAGRSLSNDDGAPCDHEAPLLGDTPPVSASSAGASNVAGASAAGSSSRAGSSGGGSTAPPLPSPSPQACQGSCSGCDPVRGVCFIECNGDGACTQADLVCPDGWPCEISCHGASSCIQANVWCPEGYRCSLDCGGRMSCIQLSYHCTGASCELWCNDEYSCEQLQRE